MISGWRGVWGLNRKRYVERSVGREGKRVIMGGDICIICLEKRCVSESKRHDVTIYKVFP